MCVAMGIAPCHPRNLIIVGAPLLAELAALEGQLERLFITDPVPPCSVFVITLSYNF